MAGRQILTVELPYQHEMRRERLKQLGRKYSDTILRPFPLPDQNFATLEIQVLYA